MNTILFITNRIERIRDLTIELSRQGFASSSCSNEEDVIEHDRNTYFDIAIIDISNISPSLQSVWTWFRKLKLHRRIPIIALVSASTLHLIRNEHSIDDFIIEPWDIDELSARIGRIISRTNKSDDNRTIRAGSLIIDLVKCEVAIDGRLLTLTFKEYEMLKLLASNKGRVFTREALLNEIWGYDYFGGDRTVDVHIRRLRSKIEDAEHSFIETVRNIGYKFKDA